MKIVEGIDYHRNFRSLEGLTNSDGYSIKENTLYRSGNLYKLTNEEIQTVENIGIKTIIDLRKEEKAKEKPDYIGKDVKYYNIPLYDSKKIDENNNTITDYDNPYLNSYIFGVSSEYSLEAIRKIFALILKEPKPILIHCNLGRDRTGIICYLIEKVLSIKENEILDDYMFSNFSNLIRLSKKVILKKDSLFTSYNVLSNYFKKFFVNEKNYQVMENTIIYSFGSFDNYFNNVLKIDIDNLKQVLLLQNCCIAK